MKTFLVETAISTVGSGVVFGLLWFLVDPNGFRHASSYLTGHTMIRFALLCSAQGLIFATASHISRIRSE